MTEVSAGLPRTGADAGWMRLGALAVIAALVADVLYNVNVKKGDNGGTGPMITVAIGIVVVGAVLYLLVFPRFQDHPRAALVTGIISFVTLAAFWSCAPLLVGAAAIGYGLKAQGATPARIGMGLAAVAMVVDFVGAVLSAA